MPPPPLPPPPAEASVGMSAAAPMAATVATAKIVLRIMGKSCLSVGRAIRRVQWRLDKKTGAKSSGKRKGRGQVCVRAGGFVPLEQQRRLSLPFGVCRKAGLDRECLRHALPRQGTVAISRRDRLSCVFLLEEQSNGDRAYLFDHQTRCYRPQFDRCDQRYDRGRGLAYRRAKAHAHQP